jgi:hypothetical protein
MNWVDLRSEALPVSLRQPRRIDADVGDDVRRRSASMLEALKPPGTDRLRAALFQNSVSIYRLLSHCGRGDEYTRAAIALISWTAVRCLAGSSLNPFHFKQMGRWISAVEARSPDDFHFTGTRFLPRGARW